MNLNSFIVTIWNILHLIKMIFLWLIITNYNSSCNNYIKIIIKQCILRDITYQYIYEGLFNYDKSIFINKLFEFAGDFLENEGNHGEDFHNDIDEDSLNGFRDNLLSLLNHKK